MSNRYAEYNRLPAVKACPPATGSARTVARNSTENSRKQS